MKKLALALVAATAAFVGQATAADMPMKAARPVAAPIPVANWTGCYIGGGGGYGLFDQENTGFVEPPLVPVRTLATATWDTGGRGWFGTVQGGCDYQFGGIGPWQIVVGAFGDYDFADIKGNLAVPGFDMVGSEKLDHSWSVGGRIGVLITPQLLTYFSGGYTESTFNRVNFVSNLIPIGVPTGLFIDQRTYKGWFLGAGDEYALSFLPGLFWKTEYRLSRLDTQTNPIIDVLGLPTFSTIDSKKWVHTVRSELVWHFNFGGGPVVAKY